MTATVGELQPELERWVATRARELEVPGVAVGVLRHGEESYAYHGVTSLEHPLPVDEHTLFQFGSTGKTFTATAIMRLVERGDVRLDATVRTYLPELRLKDEDVARRVTVLQLLNHTAGWDGDFEPQTGAGDDALERMVAKLVEVDQVYPLGESFSYNNASLSVAGRIIEKVTGKTYEAAIAELLFKPLGMEHSFFFPNDVMTRRYAIGHDRHDDGRTTISRPWALPRCGNPAGGIAASAGDQIAWARFHLGDGRAPDGTRLLSPDSVRLMQQPTVPTGGSALGDAIGISWMLHFDYGGVRTVGHGGTTNGQHSTFEMVPERGFAVASLTNCGPNGPQFNTELWHWALERYLGVVYRDPEPLALPAERLRPYLGTYETIAATARIVPDGGGLLIEATIKPEARAEMRDGDSEEDDMSFPIGLLPGDGDRYIVTGGPAKGLRGYFARDDAGTVVAVHIGGRLATRAG